MTIGRRTFLTLSAATAALGSFRGLAFAQGAGGPFVAAMPREILTLDGNYANLRENDILGLMIDDALFAVDPVSASAVPLAAQSHSFEEGNKLLITIRDDVLFHDGQPLTVEDVVYTYTHMLDPATENSYQGRFSHWLEGVEAVDDRTVRFDMKFPYSMALFDLAMYSKLRRKDVYAAAGGGIDPNAQTLQVNGTGPYRVVSFRPGQEVRLQRFEGYRAGGPKGTPAMDEIIIRNIPDWSTQAAEVISGGVHWTFGMPDTIAEGAHSTGAVALTSGPSLRNYYISMDAAGMVEPDGPLTNALVRQAINHAIDRQSILDNLRGGKGEVLKTSCIPMQFGCTQDGVTEYGHDPDRARALLAEAGYPDGFSTELWAARDEDVVAAVAEQLGRVGINVAVRQVKGPSLSEARRDHKIPMEWASSGSFGIPDSGAIMLDRLGPGSSRNYTGDDEMAAAVLAAVSTFDPAEREAEFAKALRIMADQAYWVPMYTDEQNYLMSPDLDYEGFADGMDRLYTARWS